MYAVNSHSHSHSHHHAHHHPRQYTHNSANTSPTSSNPSTAPPSPSASPKHLSTLDTLIYQILSSPSTDLDRISIRSIRSQLPLASTLNSRSTGTGEGGLITKEWIGRNMDLVDKRIMDIFEEFLSARDGF